MIDVLAKVRQHLMWQGDLVALTSNRIYAGRNVPPKGYKPEDGPAIAFRVRGGGLAYEDDHVVASVQFKFYEMTELAAHALYRTFADEVIGSVSRFVKHIELDTIGSVLEEPGTDWVFVLAYVSFLLPNVD